MYILLFSRPVYESFSLSLAYLASTIFADKLVGYEKRTSLVGVLYIKQRRNASFDFDTFCKYCLKKRMAISLKSNSLTNQVFLTLNR